MKKTILLLTVLFITILSCNKDDENSNNQNPVENEVVVVAERIEFSSTNIIPNGLRVLSLDGSTDVNQNENIPLPLLGDGLEFLKDANNNLIFLKKNLPNQDNSKINAESTVLFMTTSNSTYYDASPNERINIINSIKSNDLYVTAINILLGQQVINLFADEYMAAINEIVRFICQTPDVEQNSLQLGTVDYFNNSTTVTINNPTENHIGLGVYINDLQQGIQVIDSGESTQFEMTEVNSEYRFKLMSGEEVATSIFNDNDLEEIEAFDDDIKLFLLESFFALSGNLVSVECINDILNLVLANIEVVLLVENSPSTFEAVETALEFVFDNYAGVIESANSCSSENLDSFVEVLDDIGQIFKILGYRDYFCGIINKINDFERYDNIYEICLETDGNGVFLCSQNNTEPVLNPIPNNGAIDITLNGNLSFTEGTNTPTDAEYRLYFDTSVNPTSQFNLGNQTSYNYSNLQENTVYYWYVETLSNSGSILATSPIWSFSTVSNSGGIYNGNVDLITQQEVDDFGANNYSEINGWLFINSTNVNDLSILSSLTSISGDLTIQGTSVTNLNGLNNITTVGGLNIRNSTLLTSLSGLGNLTNVNGLCEIVNNSGITNLDNLSNLNNIVERLYINANTNLSNINGLSNLTTIGGYLAIHDNDSLIGLQGLENLSSVGDYLSIRFNDSINNFCSIQSILQNDGVTNSITIMNNIYNPTVQDIIDGNCSQ